MPTSVDYGLMELGLSIPPNYKRDAVMSLADKIAMYVDRLYTGKFNGRNRQMLVVPIDYGGSTKALPFFESPLRNALNRHKIELVCTPPLNQSTELDDYSEYRPILEGPEKLEKSMSYVVMLMDISAGTSPDKDNVPRTGTSIMGGVCWACQQAFSLGDDYRPSISAAVVRDEGLFGVANFSVRNTSQDWVGPKEYMRSRMPNAFRAIGGDNPSSPWNDIAEDRRTSLRGKWEGSGPENTIEACGLQAFADLLLLRQTSSL